MKKKNKETLLLIAVLVVACIIVVGTLLIKNNNPSTGKEPTEIESVTEKDTGGITIEDKDPDGGNWTPIK